MVDIALGESGSGVFQKDISYRQKISVKYLDTIIASLKSAGLITTSRGKKSGYRLTRQADQIKILDIYRAFEPEVAIVDCMSCNYACELSESCGAREFWEILNKSVIDHFQTYTLDDLVQKHKKKQKTYTGEV
jgi:Rrf2 family protein